VVDDAMIVTIDCDVGVVVVYNRVQGYIVNDELKTRAHSKCVSEN